MHKRSFLNGEFIPIEEARIHVSDLAIQRAYGVFDFFAVRNGVPCHLPAHLERFYHSASRMRLQLLYTKQQLTDIIRELLDLNQSTDCGIRLTLTGGYSENGYAVASPNLIITEQSRPPLPTAALRLMTYAYERQFPDVKTIDYLMGVWLQPLLQEKGFDDVIYCSNGLVTECPRSNVFVVTPKKEILTPATRILRGITRERILNIKDSIYSIKEADVSIEILNAATEVFISSTTKGVFPVFSINGKKLAENGVAFYLQQRLNAE